MANANCRARAFPTGTNPYAFSVHAAILQGSRASQGHPEPAALQRFLLGGAQRDEARAIVRHLVAGCPECAAAARPVWGLHGGKNGGHEMSEGEKEDQQAEGGESPAGESPESRRVAEWRAAALTVRAIRVGGQLWVVIDFLKAASRVLQGVVKNLTPSVEQAGEAGLEQDVWRDARGLTAAVLADCVERAVADLISVVLYQLPDEESFMGPLGSDGRKKIASARPNPGRTKVPHFAAPLGANGGPEVDEVIAGARQEFRAAAGDLKSIRYRMLGVHASIPPSSQETSKGDLEGEMDVETEFRNVIACGIQDGLDPLIDDWLNAASYQPVRREAAGNPEAESLSIAHLDLSVFSEETRLALYEVVAAENFGPAETAPGESSVPQYTAEQAGLEVVFAWGRWFATWWRLELADTLPEAQRRETLLLEENRHRPGTLAYREV
jgi:hypothetical protein